MSKQSQAQQKNQVTYKGAYIGVSTPFSKDGDETGDKKLKRQDSRKTNREEVEKMMHDAANEAKLAEQ